MPLPLKLTQNFSRHMLSDVLCRMLTHASSVTNHVDVPAVVGAVVSGQPEFRFQSNNDFGMLVDRLGEQAFGADRSLSEADSLYTTIAQDDEYVEHHLGELTYELAGSMITIYSVLRDDIPNEVDTLTKAIDNLLKDRLQEDPIVLPAAVVQDWGNLRDESYMIRSINLCRDRANIFEENRPIREYYVSAALAAAENVETFDVSETTGAEIAKIITDAFGSDLSQTDERFVSNVFCKEYGIRNLVAMVRIALDGGKELHRGLTMFTKIEHLIATLSEHSGGATTSESLAAELARKLPALEGACLLISGAFYALAATTYKDTLIMTCSDETVVVNGLVIPTFMGAGGTVDDVRTFGFYLNHHGMRTPSAGWTATRVASLIEAARSDLIVARTEAERRLQADNTVLLRTVIDRVVKGWLASDGAGLTAKTSEATMDYALNKLLTGANNPAKSMGDLLTDYLVTVRNNALLKYLKSTIYSEFSAMLSSSDERDGKIKKNYAVTKAMASVAADLLIKAYGEVRESVS